jgi:hypothetical protein
LREAFNACARIVFVDIKWNGIRVIDIRFNFLSDVFYSLYPDDPIVIAVPDNDPAIFAGRCGVLFFWILQALLVVLLVVLQPDKSGFSNFGLWYCALGSCRPSAGFHRRDQNSRRTHKIDRTLPNASKPGFQ